MSGLTTANCIVAEVTDVISGRVSISSEMHLP